MLRVLEGWQRHAPTIAGDVAYLRERQAQLDYPAFRQQGWPVGSGATESAHKTVMQARMKRAGMHWAREQVNPLLAVRLLECNGRWTAEGPAVLREHRVRGGRQRRGRRLARRPAPPALPAPPLAPVRPPAPHPWRRYAVPLSAKK